MSPIQKILFGSPGTGKSHKIVNQIIPNDLSISDQVNIVKTVFHPEYTYGDFVGKLVPHSKAGKVEYRFFAGHFLIALSQAYKNILECYDKDGNKTKEPDNVVLVIDEINRGNSSAIFGTVFQLLDREEDGWSSYFLNITELELLTILELMGVKIEIDDINTRKGVIYQYKFPGTDHFVKDYVSSFQNRVEVLRMNLTQKQIYMPPNLSIVATMNTSDNSIYFMDNAFKRRWDWEFLNIEDDNQRNVVNGRKLIIYGEDRGDWNNFVDKLNLFIRRNYKAVRKIEDKQIGYFFINENEVNEAHIKNKLMFFVWDSVFHTNKKPLQKLLDVEERSLVTFGQFTQEQVVKSFINKILEG